MFAYKNLGVGTYEQKELEAAFKETESFQEIRIGSKFLFYRSFIRVKYITIDEVKKAFLRVESGESGDFPTTAVYLVLVREDGKEISLHMERVDTAKKMIAYMEDKFPSIQYGFTK